jgi:hypothetical protein
MELSMMSLAFNQDGWASGGLPCFFAVAWFSGGLDTHGQNFNPTFFTGLQNILYDPLLEQYDTGLGCY